MAETWPVSLPRSMSGVTWGTRDGRMKSQTDTGPGKIRRRSTAMPYTISGQMLLTRTQLATLDTFITTTTAGGVLAFNFPHPNGGAATLCRFADTLPTKTWAGSGKVSVDIMLEVMP